MHHKNSIISILLMGGFLALSLVACEPSKPPYPDGSTTTTGTTDTTGTTGTTGTTMRPCATHQVILDNLQFNPSSLTIKPCDKVTWVHQDGQAPHTVTSGMSPPLGAPLKGLFDSRGADANARMTETGTSSFSHTFNSAGTFPYHCEVHGAPNGAMNGTINVSP